MIIQVNPVIDYSVRGLCCREYPNHKKGCPNFNKKEGCPPKAEYFDKVYDLSKPIYAIYNIFDFKSHVEKMKKNNPTWTKRQVECCLYWQPKARNQLLVHMREFYREYGSQYKITTCPEAMGVNITDTMKNAGIILEWPPENITYQIALAGIPNE
jgi:predicted metal-binding protein